MSKDITLPGIRRTCDKIQSVLMRKELNLKSYFISLDCKRTGLVTETKFFTVIYNQLGHEFGVCQEEVKELTDYFKEQDGRVCYKEFLDQVLPKEKECKAFVSGLEWESHDHVNVLTSFELRQLDLILTKITYSLRCRECQIDDYFKDYEWIGNGCGTMSIAHFQRILDQAGITLGPKEFQLVVRRFLKYGYVINYIAFLDAIHEILKWFDRNGFLNTGKDFLENYPGKVITIENLEQLPRPEVCNVDIAKVFDTTKSCHPFNDQNKRKQEMDMSELLLRIKKHIYDNKIRSREFFEKFDKLRRGFVTKFQFHRGLEAIGISGLHRLYIAKHDLEKIFDAYKYQRDPDRISWKDFCDDIDEVFTVKNLDKLPYVVVKSPPDEIKDLPCKGSIDWNSASKSMHETAQEAIFRIRDIVKSRRIFIEVFFNGFDKLNHFHVSSDQMRRVFSSNSILLSEKEIQALILCYGDDMGFNYWKFMRDVNEVQFCEAKHKKIVEFLQRLHCQQKDPCSNPNYSVVEILAKIKNQVTRNRINIEQFMKDGEKLNNGMLSACQFRARFPSAGIFLTDCELDILCNAFKYSTCKDKINFRTFCEMMNQAFFDVKLEKRPCTVPTQHVPSSDDYLNFLTYEERHIASHALQKLARHYNNVSNMETFFKDRETKCFISKETFRQVLTICGGLMDVITQKELDVLYKTFSIATHSNGRKFNYRNFLTILKHVYNL
ncbi:CLUMA_CG018824, isoform A [Clunio marinus]|uniref:CLUMA_CG018824, isoform A n=1 Tax=Clunio marinus TaxID=568069 RepID=A0A1J1J204_9DIPT|nr:CLUMA_CG018824, isoform A [Clunio marinus]